MATTNAGNSNEGKAKYNRSVEGEKKEKRIFTTDNRKNDRQNDRQKSDFRRSNGVDSRNNGESKGNGEYKPRGNGEYKPRTNGEYKPRGNGEFKPRANGEYKPRTNGEYKPRTNGGYEKSNNGGYSNSFNNKGFDKDKDEDASPVRKPRPKVDSKPKEPQMDKLEIMSRLEKEKKAMKKKHTESRNESKPARHVAKPKRSGNIDWTREYENDSYDDDDLDMYL